MMQNFRRYIIFLFIALGFVAMIDLNSAIFLQKMELKKGGGKAETAITIAKSFEGSPYVAHTLEQSPEHLVVNLREFDCVTFVESVLALTQARGHNVPKYYNFQQYLTQLRYRGGKIDGYGSRLHYFSEWIFQNTSRGVVADVTATLTGHEALAKKINFMSLHRNLYGALSVDSVFQAIQKSEAYISSKTLNHIPKSKVKGIENQLIDGDIVAITSGIEGLDFNHEGFVIRKNDRVYLLHASTDAKKVVIASEPLADYLARIKKHTGIVVLRIK